MNESEAYDYGSGGELIGIRTPWQSAGNGIRYTYTNGALTGITYEDGKETAYAYLSAGAYRLLSKVTGHDGQTAEYGYANAGTV